jgi:hypothetical protein
MQLRPGWLNRLTNSNAGGEPSKAAASASSRLRVRRGRHPGGVAASPPGTTPRPFRMAIPRRTPEMINNRADTLDRRLLHELALAAQRTQRCSAPSRPVRSVSHARSSTARTRSTSNVPPGSRRLRSHLFPSDANTSLHRPLRRALTSDVPVFALSSPGKT